MSPRGLAGKSGDLSGDETSQGSGVINLGLGTPNYTNNKQYTELDMFPDVQLCVCVCVCVCMCVHTFAMVCVFIRIN